MNRRSPGAAALLLASLAAQEPPRPQEPQERIVQVTVVSVAERSVYLDRGRDAGLDVGMYVQLFPAGFAPIDAQLRSVSGTSARAELPPGVPAPPIGTRGELRVRAVDAPPPPRAVPRPTLPEHPPWTRREGERAIDQPLLVPAYGERPDRRPAQFDGRAFLSTQWNRDDGGDRSSDYVLSRLGVSFDATNHLGAAERIRFAGEVDDRRVSVADAQDQVDQNGRLDLLSVAFGTEAWAPTGVELGRFYSQLLPEIGLVDGVEVVQRFVGGVRIGGGFGSYPRPFPARDTGEDLGVHAYFDYTADPQRSFAAAIGVQKTWHEGEADRDLVLLRVEGRPAGGLWLFGSAKIDIYTGSDTIKGSGADVTEAYGTARWDGAAAGTGLSLSHFTWPELLRREYQNLPAELVADGVVDRLSWSGWLRPVETLRLAVRADGWRDQERDGTAWAFDGDLRDALGERTVLLLSVFGSDGSYSSGPGARVGFRAPLADGSWRVDYRWHRYELTGLVTGAETFLRQSAELGLSLPIAQDGDLDCSLEHWFGDREDAWSLGIYVQWRF